MRVRWIFFDDVWTGRCRAGRTAVERIVRKFRPLATIKRKVIFAFGFCAATMAAIGMFSEFSVSRMRIDIGTMYARNTLELAKLSNVTISVLNSRATLRRLQATRHVEDVESFAPVIRADLDEAEREWASYRRGDLPDDETRLLARRVNQLIAENRKYADEALAAFTEGRFDSGAAVVNEGADVASTLTRLLRDNVALSVLQAKRAADESAATATRIREISLALISTALLLAAIVSGALLRSILTPITHAVRIANDIASGKLDNRFAVDSHDEIGRLFRAMKKMERRLRQMIYYDPLTSTPNRVLFNQRLSEALAACSHGALVGAMMIDIDRFKGINDTLGHATGDRLLREAAGRLTACVRPSDTVARLGGDEFAVLLPHIEDTRQAEEIAAAIIARFDECFELDGKEVFVSCSIGIALYPPDGASADDLMKFADSAMYLAKRSGRRGFRFYTKELTATAAWNLTIESELRRAIERGEFELHYQPKVSLRSGEIVGSEALLRWHRPGVGLVPPSTFIPVAEEAGLIVDLGEWVLREACRTAAEWNAEGAVVHKIAANLSARQFQCGDIVRSIDAILAETGCRPEWIEIEITESLLLAENATILGVLSSFKERGISIAIDDFGTGYASLSYLAQFPIDTLKIDRSFVQKVNVDRRHAELVKAIVSIGQCLGLQIVAEGVETSEQVSFLLASGCEIGQGFLYGKPLCKAAIRSLPPVLCAHGA